MAERCPLPIDWLDFLSGENDVDLRHHLDRCPSCREVVRLLRTTPRSGASAAAAIASGLPMKPLAVEVGFEPQPGQIWLTKGAFARHGYAYTDHPRTIVLVTAAGAESHGERWLYAVPLMTDVENALDGDLVLQPTETDLGMACRVPLAQQIKLSTSQLEGVAGGLKASGMEWLNLALDGRLPMDHSGAPAEGADDPRLDQTPEMTEALGAVAGYYWHVREQLNAGTEQAAAEATIRFGTVDVDATQGAVELAIRFAQIRCPNCGEATIVRRDHRCANCRATLTGEARGAVDVRVQTRRQAFKGRLRRIEDRAEQVRLLGPAFASRGSTVPPDEFLRDTLQPACRRVTRLSQRTQSEMRSVFWDASDPACIAAFKRLVGALDEGIDLVASLAGQLPPIECRAAHRILTRASGHLVAGYIKMATSLVAIDAVEALERRNEAQRLLDRAETILRPLGRVIAHLMEDARPGWWMTGDTVDLAAIAWRGVERTPTNIMEAGGTLKSILSDNPGVSDLADEQALLLLPAIVLGATAVDPVAVGERARRVRAVLDTADRDAPGWVADADELVDRVNAGVHATIDHAERVGFSAAGPQSRRMALKPLIDVYRDLIEGPMRDFGGVLVIAARARNGAPNASYMPAVARGVVAGDVMQEFEHLEQRRDKQVEMHLRNAAAHAGATVLEHGVRMTQRAIVEGISSEQTVSLTDGEFMEEFASVQEFVLALELAIVPWLLTNRAPVVATAVASVHPTQREREGLVRLLAGLRGVLEVTFEGRRGALLVRGTLASGSDTDPPQIPSLLPAIFNLWPNTDAVTLDIRPRGPVTFLRAEMPPVPADSAPHGLSMVGLVGRRWLGDLRDESAAIRADVTYLVRPQIKAVLDALRLASVQPPSIGRIAAAEKSLRLLSERIHSADVPPGVSPLVPESARLVDEASQRLHRLGRAFSGNADDRGRRRQAIACAALVDIAQDIDGRAAAWLRVGSDRLSGEFQLTKSRLSVTPLIRHQQIVDFADARVNLPFNKVREFRDRVNSLRDSLEAKIAADPPYAIIRTLHSGSVAKGTALRTVNDFDLAVYLKPDQVPADERLLASWLIARLKEARPQLADDQFIPEAHCVTIAYRDGTKVDVVPVLDVGDGSEDGYLIQKDTGIRVLTNIRRHLEFIRERKKRVPVHFQQVVRLVKFWIRLQKTDEADFRFKSFLAELLCAHLLDQSVDISDYAKALGAFFEYVVRSGLREPVVFDDYYTGSSVTVPTGVITVVDPVNPGNNVAASYTEHDRKRIVVAAQAALDAIDYATYVPTKGEAVAAWREVLGTGFQG